MEDLHSKTSIQEKGRRVEECVNEEYHVRWKTKPNVSGGPQFSEDRNQPEWLTNLSSPEEQKIQDTVADRSVERYAWD